MKGSIDKYTTKSTSKPHWRFRIYKGKDAAGVKQYDTRGGFEKQKDAADAMSDRIDELQRLRGSESAIAEQISLGCWLDRWLDTYAVHKCQPKTLERYRQLARYKTSGPDECVRLAAMHLQGLSHKVIEPALYALLKAKENAANTSPPGPCGMSPLYSMSR
jgi:Arm DNA-binding domain